MRQALVSSARLLVVLWAAILALGCSSAGAFTISAARGDGSRVYFATDEPLLPADTDTSVDIYERAHDFLSLVTIGDPSCQPGCGNGSFDVDTTQGIHLVPGGLIFSTAESLLPADTDNSVDIYERTEEGLKLLSQGPNGFNGEFDAHLRSISSDGSAVVFETAEQLVGADTDSSVDVYRRSGETTELISQGSHGFNGEFDAEWAASSADESTVFFLTAEQELSPDTDAAVDLYGRHKETTTLISRGPEFANDEFDVSGPVMTSADGSRTVFLTSEQLREADEDEQPDIYMRFGTTTSLVSGGQYNPYEGEYPAELNALDPVADQVVFTTRQVLAEEDRDKTGQDVWEWFYGKDILVSQSPLQPLNPPPLDAEFLAYVHGGLGAVLFVTTERLVAEDTDSSPDIYERLDGVPKPTEPFNRSEGTTYLISRGPGAFNGAFAPTFQAVSPDGSRVFFTTREQLVSADTDSSVDLYERLGGATTKLLSAGQVNGNGSFDVSFEGDGSRPLFLTSEQLVEGDDDNAPDLYERIGKRTELVSTTVAAPGAPVLSAVSPPSPSNVNTPSLTGTSDSGTTVEVFANAACSGEPIAEGSAAELASAGITAAVPDDSTTSFAARAVNEDGIAGPCSNSIGYVEDSTPPATPVLSSIDPPGPANDNSPRLRGSAEAGTTTRTFGNPSCGGAAIAEANSGDLAGPGIPVAVPDNTTTLLAAVAIDRAGNASACAAPLSYTEDSTPPQTKIVGGPRNTNVDKTPSFHLQANDRTARFTCRVDARPVTSCPRFYTLRRLKLGKHRLSVAAVDLAGNVDPSPALRVWKIVPIRVSRRARPRRRHHRHQTQARRKAFLKVRAH